MQITEVRIKLMEDPGDRLCAFCSITLDDCFVIRDLKIIQGTKGAFVAMPSRKLTDRCPKCHYKNHLRANFCNQCGVRLHSERASKDDDGRAKLYADIAHPINSECRDQIQQMVIAAYEEELIKAQQEDYICTYDDFEEDRFASLNDEQHDSEDTACQTAAHSAHNTPAPHSSNPGNSKSYPPREQEADTGKMLRVDAAGDRSESGGHARDPHGSSQGGAGNNKSASEAFGDGII